MIPHPRLSSRLDAVVRVHLKEVLGGLPAEHSIDLRLRVSVDPGDHADRVKELVLAKAAKILRRVKGALESTSGEVAQAASVLDRAPDQDLGPAPDRSDSPGQDKATLSCPTGHKVLFKPI